MQRGGRPSRYARVVLPFRAFCWLALYGLIVTALQALMVKCGLSDRDRGWVMAGAGVALVVLIGHIIRLGRRQLRWEREGRCPHCGFDRAGLEPRERCGGCGKLPPL